VIEFYINIKNCFNQNVILLGKIDFSNVYQVNFLLKLKTIKLLILYYMVQVEVYSKNKVSLNNSKFTVTF